MDGHETCASISFAIVSHDYWSSLLAHNHLQRTYQLGRRHSLRGCLHQIRGDTTGCLRCCTTSTMSLSFLPSASPSQLFSSTAVPQYPSLAPPPRIKPVYSNITLLVTRKPCARVISSPSSFISHKALSLTNTDQATDNQLTAKHISQISRILPLLRRDLLMFLV